MAQAQLKPTSRGLLQRHDSLCGVNMIECSSCASWVHKDCVPLTAVQFQELSKDDQTFPRARTRGGLGGLSSPSGEFTPPPKHHLMINISIWTAKTNLSQWQICLLQHSFKSYRAFRFRGLRPM